MFRDLTLGYDRHPAVHHITGEVERGALVAIVGPNGAGKSTLLKGIIGELKPLGGSLDPRRPRQIRHRLSAATDRDRPQLSDLGVRLRGDGAVARDRRLARARCASATTRLPARWQQSGWSISRARPVGALSGGQFQRVLFARLLLQDAALILLDEPFRAVDTKTIADLIALILRWHAEGRTVLAALHDIEQVRAHFPDDAADRPRGGGLGRDAQSPDASQSRQVAAVGRGVRRACRHLRAGRGRSASGSRHDRRDHRSVHRVLVHAPGAGRLPGAVDRRAADRRVPDAAAHEPDGRRHEPRHPARRGGRLSRCRAVAAGHVARRLRRRARGGARRGRWSRAPLFCARMRASPLSIWCRWRSAC